VKIWILFFKLPEFVAVIESLFEAAAMKEMDLSFMSLIQGISQNAPEGRKSGARSDHYHFLFRSPRAVVALAVGAGDFEGGPNSHLIAEPGGDLSIVDLENVQLDGFALLRKACDRIATDHPIRVVNPEKLARFVVRAFQ
jgi:hypothetical protein